MQVITFTMAARRSHRKLPPDVRERIDKALYRYGETGAGDVKVMVAGLARGCVSAISGSFSLRLRTSSRCAP